MSFSASEPVVGFVSQKANDQDMIRRDKFVFDPQMIDGNIYVCGDIHGRVDLLLKFIDWVDNDGYDDIAVVFLGDYIDRGPNARSVIERLIEGPNQTNQKWYPIKGNHDEMLVRTYRDPTSENIKNWLECGAFNTIKSYSTAMDLSRISPDHVDFLENLPLGYDDGRHLFVHAGIRPNVPMWRQNEHDLLWIREPFLSQPHHVSRVVVHGHTITDLPKILPWRIGLDIGAYATNRLAGARFSVNDKEPRFWISD